MAAAIILLRLAFHRGARPSLGYARPACELRASLRLVRSLGLSQIDLPTCNASFGVSPILASSFKSIDRPTLADRKATLWTGLSMFGEAKSQP